MSGDAVVLLSGGQDSATCAMWARAQGWHVHAVTVGYGQRHLAELAAAQRVCARIGAASHVQVDVPLGALGGDSALLRRDGPVRADGGLPDRMAPGGLPTSYVPGRNLVLLSLAVARAGAIGAEHVVTGVCQTDYSGYPDCRRPFVEAFDAAARLALPSSRPVRVHAPLMDLSKADTVRLAMSLDATWELVLGETLTCYHGQRPGCGTCPACELRARGFAEAGVPDPAEALQ